MISTRLKGELQHMVELSLAASRQRPVYPVSFIEQKLPDFQQLPEILRLSADTGIWTNFGPVSSLLESAIEQHLNLSPTHAVVMCSSGTAALLSLIGLKEYRAHRRLRWVVSAFGFRASCLGPLAGARVLDCDDTGILDLDLLRRLDPASWDGVVVTNVFGLKADLREYTALCRHLGKELIVDNAGLLDGFVRDDPHSTAGEILSFHQTKPWGMGEGGCAVLPRDQAAAFRALINGGDGLCREVRAWASNSKISDVSCALILQRLLQAPEWSCGYQDQARRILHIAVRAGLQQLAPMDLTALTPPHLPMLAPDSVTEADLAGAPFVMQKYYEPLGEDCPAAAAIYDRIVNIPCHPDMALLTDEEIRAGLERLPGCGRT